MKTVQCTFRLPKEVVDLIDEQSGKTRTDKLLNLITMQSKSAFKPLRVVFLFLKARSKRIVHQISSVL
ncbi:hypothetical protein ACP5PY_26855, partial [Photobacterium leiognathi subsp. mandapamensis]